MQLQGEVDLLLHCPDQALREIGGQERSHVLDADAVRTHIRQFVGNFHVVVQRVHGAYGIDHGSLEMLAGGLDGLTATWMLRVSFRASNTRKISTPESAANRMKSFTISSL